MNAFQNTIFKISIPLHSENIMQKIHGLTANAANDLMNKDKNETLSTMDCRASMSPHIFCHLWKLTPFVDSIELW